VSSRPLPPPGFVAPHVRRGRYIFLKAAAALQATKFGPSLDPSTQVGPAVSAMQRDHILGYLNKGKKEGASVVLDGTPPAYMVKFRNEAEAVDLVNRFEYGMANSARSADLSRANRVAEQLLAGNNWINAHNVFGYGLPYGGNNLSGFGGGVNSPATFDDYLRPQTIARPLA